MVVKHGKHAAKKEVNYGKNAAKGVALATAVASLTTPAMAMADEPTQQTVNESATQIQEVTPAQAARVIEQLSKETTPQPPTQADINAAQQQVNADTQNKQQAQQEQANAQAAQQAAQAAQQQAQQQAVQAAQQEQAAQQAAQAAQQEQAAKEEQVAQEQANVNKVAGETHATQEDVAAQQGKVNQAQADVNAGQAAADTAQKEEAEQQAKTDDSQKAAEQTKGIQEQTTQQTVQATTAKEEADKKVAEAQKAYDEAKANRQDQVDSATQALSDAKANQVKAQGDYTTKKEAEDAAQKALDAAKKELADAKKQGAAINQEKVNKGFTGLLESVMNDPTATQVQKDDATSAYKLLTTGVYEGSKLSWFDKVNTADKEDGASIVGMQNAITYFDAVNAIRKKHGLNELGINLTAMVMAMMNTSYSGQVNWGHSGMLPANENIANGVYGAYTGTTDVDLWQKAYDAQWNDGPQLTDEEREKLGNSWPFTNWYTVEKAIYESGNTNYTSVGHYLNLISGGIKSFGFGVGDGIAAFDGSWEDSSYTTAGFTTLVNSYVKTLNTGNQEGIQQAQRKYDAAKTAYDKAQEESNASKAALDAAEEKLKNVQANYDKVTDDSYLSTLEKDVQTKKAQAATAQSKLEEAKTAQKKAEDSYAQAVKTAQEEAAKLALKKENTAQAKNSLAGMVKTLQDAQSKFAEIKADASVLPDAQAKLADAEKALKEAQDAYQKALANYEFAKVTNANATEELNNKIVALQDAEAKLEKANDKLADAITALGKSTKTLKELQALKDKLDNANKPSEGGDNGNTPNAGSNNTKPGENTNAGVVTKPIVAVKKEAKGIQDSADVASKAAEEVNKSTASGENLASTGADTSAVVMLAVSLISVGAGITVLRKRNSANE